MMNPTYHYRRAARQPVIGCQRRVPHASTEDQARTLAAFAHELCESLGSILLAAHQFREAAQPPSGPTDLGALLERQSRELARLIERATGGVPDSPMLDA